MVKTIPVVLSLGFALQAFSQHTSTSTLLPSAPSQLNVSPNILSSPYQGQQYHGNNSQDVDGSPLVYDEWRSGQVITTDGQVYKIEKMNFDGSDPRFIYMLHDTMFELQSNVKEVRLNPVAGESDSATQLVFRNDMIPQQKQFVQVLTKGKITILRKFTKKPEGENYSNGIVNNSRKYVLHSEDVALVDNKVIPFKYSSSDFEGLTSDKKDQMETYIKSNKLKLKKEDDFLKSVNFYNSIN